MTITPYTIYFIELLENIDMAMAISIAMAFCAGLICLVKLFIDSDDCFRSEEKIKATVKTDKKHVLTCFIVFCILLGISTFIPSKETIMAMYAIPPIVNNTEAQKLPENLLRFANDWLEKNTEKNKNVTIK
jgi:hypothetical protein